MKETSPMSVSGLQNYKPIHAQIPSHACAHTSANKNIYHTNNIYHTHPSTHSHTHIYTHIDTHTYSKNKFSKEVLILYILWYFKQIIKELKNLTA